MAFLRSVFVTVFVAYIYAASLYALTELIRGMSPLWSWAGLFLAAGAPSAFFSWVFITRPPRTAAHPLGISIISGLGLAITMTMSWRYGDAAGLVHLWAGLAFVSWIMFLRWYSPFGNRNAIALKIGQTLPEFELQNLDGLPVQSSSFRGQVHILVFYRGNWCPYCSAQVAEMAKYYRELEAAGAKVLMISPQPGAKQTALSKRFDMPMIFLTDLKSKAASKLGIFNSWGTPFGLQLLGFDSDTVLPTVIITDEAGKAIYSHQTENYRIRPEPTLFLEVLKNHRA